MAFVSVDNEIQDGFRSRPRWSANRKIDVVLRLLRGESLEDVSREVRVEAHRLASWRDDLLESGEAGLKAKRPQPGCGRNASCHHPHGAWRGDVQATEPVRLQSHQSARRKAPVGHTT